MRELRTKITSKDKLFKAIKGEVVTTHLATVSADLHEIRTDHREEVLLVVSCKTILFFLFNPEDCAFLLVDFEEEVLIEE